MATIGPRDTLLKALAQARVNHTFEKMFRRFLAPDFLIVDDFELRRLTGQQSRDLYDLIIERHRRSPRMPVRQPAHVTRRSTIR